MRNLKGLRTVLINAGMAALEAGLVYMQGVGWIEMVGPTYAMLIIAVVNIALRWVTDTAIGKAE